ADPQVERGAELELRDRVEDVDVARRTDRVVRVLAEDAALAFGVERELDGLARLAVNVEPQALNREGARAVAGRRRILRAREARTDAGADADPARIVDLDRAGALCPMRRQQRPK